MGATGDFDPAAAATGYSIDSRTLAAGDRFCAVRGERLDGHDFVDVALARGAVAAVVSRSRSSGYPGTLRAKLLVVEDTLLALQTLGAAVRKAWGKTLVAVTG